MAHLLEKSSFLFALLLHIGIVATAAQSSSEICQRSDTTNYTSYQPLAVPCPAVGDRYVASFTITAPAGSETELIMAAKHDGSNSTQGISLASGSVLFDECRSLEESYDDWFWKGKIRDEACGLDALCITFGFVNGGENAPTSSKQFVSVWNDGGCEGMLHLDVNLCNNLFTRSFLPFEATDWEITRRCDDGATDLLPICEEAFKADCNSPSGGVGKAGSFVSCSLMSIASLLIMLG